MFADNEGNIQDGSPQKTTPATLPSHTNIVTIASSTRTDSGGNRLITLQPSIKPNKVVVINKNNIKQVPSGTIQLANRPATVTPTGVKYAKVVLSNPLKTTNPPSVGKILPSGKVEIINSAVVKPATSKYQPIIINVDPSKTTTMKNFVRVGDTQIRATATANAVTQQQLAPGLPGTNTILIKTNSLAQLASQPAGTMRKPAILNRNLTVRKVNLVPTQQPTTITPQNQSQLQPKAP